MRKRTLIVALTVIFVFFTILIGRLVNLQIIMGPYLSKMANNQQLASTKLSARRGTIYDRNMIPLAVSVTAWKVVISPNYIKDDATREIVCQGLSEILNIPKENLINLSKKKSFYVDLKKKVDDEVKNKIIEFKSNHNITDEIKLIEDYKRYYPYGSLASAVLGFTGSDGQGLSGIESYYGKTLKGESGKLVSLKNAVGTDMPYDCEYKIPAVDGKDLVLTIDATIQRILEKHLKEAISRNDVRNRGAIIAVDPKTGEILGLAVEEGFDPNEPFELPYEYKKVLENTPEEEKNKKKTELLSMIWRNKAVSDNYYPGSVFKIVVSAMGYDMDFVREDTPFNCTGGIKISEKSQLIRCHKRSGHGPMTFFESFMKSCNPAFVELGQKIGAEKFFEYYQSFGFHEKTGVDLPGETSDVFFSKNGDMKPIDLAVASIGQNFGITPMQMVMAACVIANGGELLVPRVVKEIRNKDGNIEESFSKKVKRSVISSETAKRVANMMAQNAIDKNGGLKNAYIPGMRVAGKTGTSEKKEHILVPGEKDYISSCCGFAPADDPKILALVYLDTPKGGQYYGGVVAAPVFASAMSEILPYMKIEPKFNDEEMKKYGIEVPDLLNRKLENAKSELLNLGLKPVIIGKGSTVISQMPSSGEKIAQGGSVVIYTDENSEEEKVKIPTFVGLTKSQALRMAESMGLNVSVSGSIGEDDIIVSQSPVPSEYVGKGSTVNITVKSSKSSDIPERSN